MWKFQDFSVIQILRETNFGKTKSPKNAIFVIFGALNFVTLVNFSLSKSARINKNKNSEPLNVLKWQILQFLNPQI